MIFLLAVGAVFGPLHAEAGVGAPCTEIAKGFSRTTQLQPLGVLGGNIANPVFGAVAGMPGIKHREAAVGKVETALAVDAEGAAAAVLRTEADLAVAVAKALVQPARRQPVVPARRRVAGDAQAVRASVELRGLVGQVETGGQRLRVINDMRLHPQRRAQAQQGVALRRVGIEAPLAAAAVGVCGVEGLEGVAVLEVVVGLLQAGGELDVSRQLRGGMRLALAEAAEADAAQQRRAQHLRGAQVDAAGQTAGKIDRHAAFVHRDVVQHQRADQCQ